MNPFYRCTVSYVSCLNIKSTKAVKDWPRIIISWLVRENQTRESSISKDIARWDFLSFFFSLSPSIVCNRQSNGVSHYKAPEKSCIILHQSKTSPMNNGHTNFTLIQESQKHGSASKCFIIPLDWSFRPTFFPSIDLES